MRAQHGGRASLSEGEGCWFDSSRALHDDVVKREHGGLQNRYEPARHRPSSPTEGTAEWSASGLENRGGLMRAWRSIRLPSSMRTSLSG